MKTSTIRIISSLALSLVLSLSAVQAGENQGHKKGRHMDGSQKELFVTVTSDDNMTQGMALVLANQSLDQGADVRILLCGPGGRLAIEGETGEALAPRDVTPQQLLQRLMDEGAKVEVCAIFLPNTDYGEDQLLEGIGSANPTDVAEHMLKRHVHFFTF
ncbi:putative peroxiredoxin [Natronospira proteinivora]|uniref:Peroxiredoxin n=1 Tax=Natronospira proteinivora TaxID=1807133 RepID=A0ABT1G9N9_9GAMM|nr:DsrE family protein [Natronospira proteinivora]MCP1727038.1 putative peroxiredoxin [Natronospira proteinivora]